MAPNIDTPNKLLSGYTHDEDNYEEVPKGFGLCIRLNARDGSVRLESVPDQHCTDIHPNCYAPAALENIRLLHGGGSGTAVFFGQDEDTGEQVVMKHGGPKDTQEVFSLAAITKELNERSNFSTEANYAAEEMKQKIPQFSMVYISPYHLRDRGKELWASLRGGFWSHKRETQRGLMFDSQQALSPANSAAGGLNAGSSSWSLRGSGRGLGGGSQRGGGFFQNQRNAVAAGGGGGTGGNTKNTPKHHPKNGGGEREVFRMSQELMERRFSPSTLGSESMQGRRKLRIRRSIPEDCDVNDNRDSVHDTGHKVMIDVGLTCVELEIPFQFFEYENGTKIGDGITFLQQLMVELIECQEENNWKVTLGQSAIGGESPLNGADILTNGILTDQLRTQCVDDFITVMKNLRVLTSPSERNMVLKVRQEVEKLANTPDVTLLSNKADEFVGSAIRKNYHPINGRFVKMRELGQSFRDNSLHLVQGEEIPAAFLGRLLARGSRLSTVFRDPPSDTPTLDLVDGTAWLSLLQLAVSVQPTAATDCVWTCGLTDAGLHNTFLSSSRGLELFDLGAPGIMPQPAFLTKFLMSVFHTAGMQSDGTGSWVQRFDVVDGKLALTSDTQELVPYLDKTFSIVSKRLVDELFEGDQEVQELLVRFVVLQLLSDAAFCLNRWEQKGGGDDVRHTKKSRELEKWLWRSLWDFYIASHVHTSFSIKTPAPQQPVEPAPNKCAWLNSIAAECVLHNFY